MTFKSTPWIILLPFEFLASWSDQILMKVLNRFWSDSYVFSEFKLFKTSKNSFLFFTLIGVLCNHLHLVDWCSWDDTQIGRRAIFEHEIAQILEAPGLSTVGNRFHIYDDLIFLLMGLEFKKLCKRDSITIWLQWNVEVTNLMSALL